MIFMKKWPTTFYTILKLVQQILEVVLQLAARFGVFGKEDCLEIKEEEKSAKGQVENGDAPGTRRWKSQAQVNIFSSLGSSPSHRLLGPSLWRTLQSTPEIFSEKNNFTS